MKHHREEDVGSVTTADKVRAFYQEHPYPPAARNLEAYRKRWSDPRRRRADFHLFEPTKPYREDRSILVAGCGTSQAAKYAMRWPQAKVTGIDVSTTSLEETEAFKHEFELDNLEIRELPVELATELKERFDQVVCTGVLHHLPDPDKGLQALRDVLDPQGAMLVMVYAPYGRAGIYLLQDYCRRLGIGTSKEDIGALAQALRFLPPSHPLAPLLNSAPDFLHDAPLADALLNPQDRPYSVEEFMEFLTSNDLTFGRWVRQAEYSPHCGLFRRSAHRALLEGLPRPEQYAAIELFRGTLLRHSAIVYGSDREPHEQLIRFDGDAWKAFVPIRMPDTICVTERLPEGAVGVLINPTHTQTDIFLPIDQQQKDLYDAVDNERTVGEIADTVENPAMAREFFELLWRHDQIVFDLSRQIERDE